MRHAVVALAVVILVSCSPQKRLARLLDRHPLPEIHDTVYWDTTIYRDTIVFKPIPGDTVWNDIYIPIEIDLPNTSLKTRTTLAEASAGLLDNTLWLELVQYDTIFLFKLDSAIQERSDTVRVYTEKTVTKYVKEKPAPFWRNGFLVLAGLILLSLVLFFLLRKA